MNSFRRRLRFLTSYISNPPWDTNESPPELIDFLEKYKPGRALDLGCGTGTNLITLSKYGWKADGVDFILSAVIKARSRIKAKKSTAKAYHQNILNLDFLDFEYDLILDIGCYHSLEYEKKEQYENNLTKLLKPEGYFLLYGFVQTDTPRIGIKNKDVQRLDKIFNRLLDEYGTGVNDRPSRWLLFQNN